MVAGKHFSRAPESALHFVGDEEHAMFVADFRDDAEELRRRCHESAFTQDWLSDHCSDIFGCDDAFECVFEMAGAIYIARRILQRVRTAIAVAVRNAVNLGRKRGEPGFVRMGLAGEGKT